MKLHNFKIPKLPRKLKKARYGKRGKRKHLAFTLLESKKFNKSFSNFLTVNDFNLEPFIKDINDIMKDDRYEWNITGVNESKTRT